MERCSQCCATPIETIERRFEDLDGLHPWIPNRASRTFYRIQISGDHKSFRRDTKNSLYVAGLVHVHHDDEIGPARVFSRQWL
jgi:hypothetical protein